METASDSAIPTKLCVLDAVTPAKRHRAQQFTGGKNIGVPATLARNGVLGSYPSGQLDGKRPTLPSGDGPNGADYHSAASDYTAKCTDVRDFGPGLTTFRASVMRPIASCAYCSQAPVTGPAFFNVGLAGFEPDSVFLESAGNAPKCRPASPGISEETTHARGPASGTRPSP
jgi:hypothetical protein